MFVAADKSEYIPEAEEKERIAGSLTRLQQAQEAWKYYRTAHINLVHALLPAKYHKDLWKRFVLMTIARKNFWQQWLNFHESQRDYRLKHP